MSDRTAKLPYAGATLLCATLVCVALAVFAATESKSAPLNTLTDAERAAGWRLLFDGKSLDGWRAYNGKGAPPGQQWKVVDGALTLTQGGGGNIVTADPFDSFELVLDYKISKAGNSGVMFHQLELYPEPGMSAPEVQLQDNIDGKDPQKSGWLYQLYQPPIDPKTGKPIDATRPAGQWNTLRILIDGPKGEIEMNGVKYASFEMWGDDWNQRVAKSKFTQWPEFGNAKSGSICLQDHGNPIAFRNIKIRPIARSSPRAAADVAASPPNIVYILCDDLGYGDVHALNPARGKIPTPNMDRLCAQGMTFTDAHSGSAVCTPSRYGILTGRYAWRTRLQKGVLNGTSPPLIAKDRLTVGEFLKRHGYSTAAIGKWHLGLEFGKEQWTDPISDGPLQHGFETFFGISASLDMPPFVYIENDRFAKVPTVEKKWIRKGPAAEDFEAINVVPDCTRRAVEYISAHAGNAKPFFLYLAYTAPHTPIVPTAEWAGKSGISAYGDFVMQTDAAVGKVLDALEKGGFSRNTLVVFTSDNGCSPAADVKGLEARGHFPSGDYRGYKSDVWEGGHRIPFVVRWPESIKPGTRNDALVCQTDLIATCAELLGERLPDTAGEDSISMLPLLTGRLNPATRETVVNHSIQGKFAIRDKQWKLEFCPGSGGWGAPTDDKAKEADLPTVQLYDMTADPREQKNVQADHADVVRRLTDVLQKQVNDGRSTPGATQHNDVAVHFEK